LPLFDLASQDVGSLISGQLPSWIEVGAPLDLEVLPVALAGTTMDGLAATESFDDYEALTAYLNSPEGIGGVAVVPAETVDCRVNVLAIDGFDPIRHGEFGEPTVRIGFVGDIVPGRNVGIKMREYGDYTHPFHKVAATLQSYDLTVANLEGNLSDTIPVPDDPTTFNFLASTEMLDGFRMAGIDAVSLANNHSTWNTAGWGTQGLTDTIDAIAAYELGHFGAGRDLAGARAAFTAEVAGKSIAIIGIDGVTANVEPRELNSTVNESWLGGSAYAGATADSQEPIHTTLTCSCPISRRWLGSTTLSSPTSTMVRSTSRFRHRGPWRARTPPSTSGRHWSSPTIRMSFRGWKSTRAARSSTRSATSSSTRCLASRPVRA
jgi:hypothetical protein